MKIVIPSGKIPELLKRIMKIAERDSLYALSDTEEIIKNIGGSIEPNKLTSLLIEFVTLKYPLSYGSISGVGEVAIPTLEEIMKDKKDQFMSDMALQAGKEKIAALIAFGFATKSLREIGIADPDIAQLLEEIKSASGKNVASAFDGVTKVVDAFKSMGVSNYDTITFLKEISREAGINSGYVLKIVPQIVSSAQSPSIGYIKAKVMSDTKPIRDITSKAEEIYNKGQPDAAYQERLDYYKRLTGARPIKIVGDLSRNPEFVEDVLAASRATGVSPEIITAAIEQEGLVMYLLTNTYKRGIKIDTYRAVGMDSFTTDLPEMQRRYNILGYINPQLLRATGGEIVNEDGMRTFVVRLKLDEIIMGIGGMLALRKERLEDGMRTLGIKLNEFEKDWYLYTYYAVGHSDKNERGRLAGRGYLRTEGKNAPYSNSARDLDTTGRDSIYFKAGRVAGGAALLRDLGVFNEKTMEARR